MVKRLISTTTSEVLAMNGAELKQSIKPLKAAPYCPKMSCSPHRKTASRTPKLPPHLAPT